MRQHLSLLGRPSRGMLVDETLEDLDAVLSFTTGRRTEGATVEVDLTRIRAG